MDLFIDRMPSPIGTILLVTDGEALRALEFEDCEVRMHALLRRHYRTYRLTCTKSPGDLRDRIGDYFAGRPGALDDLPVRTAGTAFQRDVWTALRRIPAGTTTTYGRLAALLGKPKAGRAIGFANGSNPVSIVVPCHRLVGADGALTGYGGGLPRKRWLLEHEGIRLPRARVGAGGGMGAARSA